MAVTLRDGVVADAAELAELVVRCNASHESWAGPLPVPPVATELAHWQAHFARPGSETVVALDGAALAGAAGFAPARGHNSTSDGPLHLGLAHVNAVFVDPASFRRGIGRALVAELEGRMRRAGFVDARLWTLEGSPAERLYAGLGWTRTAERDGSHPIGLPAVQYVRRL